MNQRVALVTGAAGGQGWAIAKRLRSEGYSVAGCDRRYEDLMALVEELGDAQVIGAELDVTSPPGWDAVVARVVDRFGSLSTLVNNAGVLRRASLADETPEGFENSWRVNSLGAFLGIRAALDRLREAPKRPSSTSAARERSARSPSTPPTVRRNGRCAD